MVAHKPSLAHIDNSCDVADFTAIFLNSHLSSTPHQLRACQKCTRNTHGPCNRGLEEYIQQLCVDSNTSVSVSIGSHLFLTYLTNRLKMFAYDFISISSFFANIWL